MKNLSNDLIKSLWIEINFQLILLPRQYFQNTFVKFQDIKIWLSFNLSFIDFTTLFFVLPDELCNLGLMICFLLRHSGVMTRPKLLHLSFQLWQFGRDSFGFCLLFCTTGLGWISVRLEWELKQQKSEPREKKEPGVRRTNLQIGRASCRERVLRLV